MSSVVVGQVVNLRTECHSVQLPGLAPHSVGVLALPPCRPRQDRPRTTMVCPTGSGEPCRLTPPNSCRSTTHRPARRGPAPHPNSAKAPTHTREPPRADRKSTRLNSSHLGISYAVFCL